MQQSGLWEKGNANNQRGLCKFTAELREKALLKLYSKGKNDSAQASSLVCKKNEAFLAIAHYNIDKTAVIKMFKKKILGSSLREITGKR